jgi:hypothetical protein
MIQVVTFSGVTSGGIVTSGTTCWTYSHRPIQSSKHGTSCIVCGLGFGEQQRSRMHAELGTS